jgi:hypothetical protein
VGNNEIAGEGIKHSLRRVKGFIKNGKYTLYATEFSEEMAQVYAFLRNSSAVSSENFIQAYRNINTLAVHYGEPVQRALTLLSKNATDKVIFIKVVDKLKQLDESIGGNLTTFFDDIITNPALASAFARNEGLVDGWKLLQNAPDGIRKAIKSLTTVSKFADEGIELTFEAIQDGARILNKNGDEVGKLIKEGTEEILEISDDFILASTSSKPLDGIKVVSNASDAEKFINLSFIKTADGSLAFVEDVSSYGSDLVKNTIKKRGDLRTVLTGIKATEDAHHIIPVQLLKENDVVKLAVEGGFKFNTAANGIAIEKFIKSTGKGRHGPHPLYTSQITAALTEWAQFAKNNNIYNAKEAEKFLTKLIDGDEFYDGIRKIIKDTENLTPPNNKINSINLNLPSFN